MQSYLKSDGTIIFTPKPKPSNTTIYGEWEQILYTFEGGYGRVTSNEGNLGYCYVNIN